ncbi:MAG: Glutamyl-tRNA reductase [Cryomorphaceae bacterium]|nr:MAG: Glutamyl-tRNA reductase [Cryomorphaceae bacterium]
MIGLISINYKHAPLDIREQFDFTDDQKLNFHHILKRNHKVEGLMILSTCNRTEIYFEYENHIGHESKLMHAVLKALVDFKSFNESLSPYLEKKTNKDVTEHIFRVIAGLESMIVGEYQIVEQLKDAYNFAENKKMLGPIISRMVQKAFETGKYIRTHTNIDKGAISVSYAAIEKVAQNFDISKIKTLCVGAGETGALTVQYLDKKGCKDITVTNRTFSKAAELANQFNIKAIPFQELKTSLSEVDVALFSTASKKSLLTIEDVKKVMLTREKEILFIDMCVPRNLSKEIGDIDGISLVNIDGLKDMVNTNYNKRKSEVIKAENFIADFLIEFEDWASSRQLRPSILSLKNQFDELIDSDTEKCICCNKSLKNCEQFSHYQSRLSKKFAGRLIQQIKKVSNHGKNEQALEIINQIFSDDK